MTDASRWLFDCVLRSRRIKTYDMIVAAAIASRVDPATGCARVEQQELAAIVGIAAGGMPERVNRLIRAGLIRVEGRVRGNAARFYPVIPDAR
jgi:predicted transcriptional regulator